MIQWAHSEYLFSTILLLLACFFIYAIYQRSTHLFRLALIPHTPFNERLPLWKSILRGLAIVCLFLALLGPYLRRPLESKPMVGREIYFLLDVSGSMNAQDISPSRLHKAKRLIRQLIQRLQGDRMGLIVFSDDAYLQCPLTYDYEMLETYVSIAGKQQFSREGTQFRPALSKALDHLTGTYSKSSTRSQAIILFSDGEDHGDAYPSLLDRLRKNGISLYTVGIGTQEGSELPMQQRKGVIRDRSGRPVISSLQDSSLRAISRHARTSYLAISHSHQSADPIFDQIDEQLMAPIDIERVATRNSLHELFLLIALFALLVNGFLFPLGSAGYQAKLEEQT